MMLDVKDISKSLGGFKVLDSVSFSVPSGDLFGLIGPNGAGKSTLFSVISGFISGDGGVVSFEGKDFTALSAPQRAKSGIVRTFQVPREFTHLTVRENLMAAAPDQSGENLAKLFLNPSRIKLEETAIAARVEETLDLLKLKHVADQASAKLSGGQKKLLELGRALMIEPRLILLDEPFAGVNPVLIAEIMEKVRELNQRGIGFVVIEHNLEALTRLVPQLAVMDRGRIIASGTPSAVLDDAMVREAYLGGHS
jgi:branched-chain amino acid transport system ATP-binding protein